MPNLSTVLNQLRQERKRAARKIASLDRAIDALNGLGGWNSSRGPRKISAVARRRIIAAQKARWAKWRKAQKG